MIQFSVVPDNFNTSIVKPLIKDQNQPGDSVSNLRPIAISNVYSSIFERILLGEIKKESTEHDKQFDFKDNSSCAHAIFVLKQVMLICKLLNRKIYILAIDLSKAFDRIYRPLLWLNMFKRNISAFIVLAFMSYYENSKVIIELDGEFSEPIKTLLGVIQGGSSSPKLFNFIGHPFLVELDNIKVGIEMGKMLINAIVYADDTLLVAKTAKDMRKLIVSLETFANNNKCEKNIHSNNK